MRHLILITLLLAALTLRLAAQETDTTTQVLNLKEERVDSLVFIFKKDIIEKTIYECYTDLDDDGSFDLIKIKELNGDDYYEEYHYTSTRDDGLYDELIYYHEVTADNGEEVLQTVMHYYQGYDKIAAWMALHLKGMKRPLPMRYRILRCMEAYTKDKEPSKQTYEQEKKKE